jgi:hypothetical protein
MQRHLVIAIAIGFVLRQPARADDDHRGHLVRAISLGHLEPPDITSKLASAGFDVSAVRFGVDLYRLEYETIDADHRPTWASGLLAVPADHATTSFAVSFTHGTELMRSGAPSTSVDSDDTWEVSPALIYASAGFVASLPDYLGMGTGPGLHPFMDVPSEASATLDMLRAARELVEDGERTLAREVFVTGFSQGAFPALAAARELARDPYFRVGAVAPISGPYHWSRWVRNTIDGNSRASQLDPVSATVYLAYFSVAWNRLHHLYSDPSSWYQVASVDDLMDGDHTPLEIVTALPHDPTKLFTDAAVAAFDHSHGSLAAAFGVIDHTCASRIPARVRLFAAHDDPDIEIDYSEDCRAELASHGTEAEVVDVGSTDHLGSNLLATPQILAWFLALRDRSH